MKGTLYIQRSKTGKRIEKPQGIECRLALEKNGTAYGFSDPGVGIAAKLLRAKVEFIAADGLFISGIVEVAPETLRYQEWWFVPETKGDDTK